MPHLLSFDGPHYHHVQPPITPEKITQESPKVLPDTLEPEPPTNPAIQTPRVEPQKQPEPATVPSRRKIGRASV